MNYGRINKTDIANGPGVRVSLFVSGCTHHCKGCFNPETWDFAYGQPFDEKAQEEVLEALSPSYITGLTLLGGEPMEPGSQRALLPFLERVREAYPKKTIWCYTGYLFDWDLLEAAWSPEMALEGCVTERRSHRARCEATDALLSLVDVVVDGEFMIEKKDISLRFRGSKNQRVIDVQESLKSGKVACLE